MEIKSQQLNAAADANPGRVSRSSSFRLPAPERVAPPYIAIKMTVAITEFPAAPAISQVLDNGLREGANFRTGLQLHNRAANEASARLVLRSGRTKARVRSRTPSE